MGVALRPILQDHKREVEWQDIQGTAVIDAHNALYQFLSIIRQPDGTPLMNREGRTTSHLSGILFRAVNFIDRGIRPVFIFDGAPPAFKQQTIEARRDIRNRADTAWQEALRCGDVEEAYKQARSASKIDEFILRTAQELLDLMGVPWLQAPSEGEAQAAEMVRRGDAAYAVSQDYDSLLFGAPVLVRNLTVSRRRKFHGRTVTVRPERIILADLLDSLGITRDDLIGIAVLVGTDFNEGIHGIGAKKAIKLVKAGAFRATLEESLPGFDPEPVLDFFRHPPVTGDYDLTWKPPDTEGIKSMLCDRFDFSEERVSSALEKLDLKAGQKTLDQWF